LSLGDALLAIEAVLVEGLLLILTLTGDGAFFLGADSVISLTC